MGMSIGAEYFHNFLYFEKMESLEKLIKTLEMTVPKTTLSLDSRPKILPIVLQSYRIHYGISFSAAI